MRYSYEFKLECIELYRQGVWPETPEGVTAKRFKHQIREWDRIAIAQGEETLKHKPNNKIWTPEEKLELVSKVLAGNSRSAVALESGISPGQLYSWVRKYKEFGYNGLVDKKKDHKSRKPGMSKKSIEPKPLTESEREELIRLRAENEAIKAEIEVVNKDPAARVLMLDSRITFLL